MRLIRLNRLLPFLLATAEHANVVNGPYDEEKSTKIEVEPPCGSQCHPQARSLRELYESWYENSSTPLVDIELGPSRKQAKVVKAGVSGVSGQTEKTIEVLGHIDQADASAGKWYYIDGTQEKPEATQAGQWLNATNSGGVTTFTVDEFANLAEEMEG